MLPFPFTAQVLPGSRACATNSMEYRNITQAPILLHEERRAEGVELIGQHGGELNRFPNDREQFDARVVEQPDVTRMEAVERRGFPNGSRSRRFDQLLDNRVGAVRSSGANSRSSAAKSSCLSSHNLEHLVTSCSMMFLGAVVTHPATIVGLSSQHWRL